MTKRTFLLNEHGDLFSYVCLPSLNFWPLQRHSAQKLGYNKLCNGTQKKYRKKGHFKHEHLYISCLFYIALYNGDLGEKLILSRYKCCQRDFFLVDHSSKCLYNAHFIIVLGWDEGVLQV